MNLLYANDRPGLYPGSYYAATAPLSPPRPALTNRVRADVCVIGAGYTGLSAALHLAEAGADVVLLEAHRVGWGASGRNGGQLGSGQRVDQTDLEEGLGPDRARALWDLGEAAKGLVKHLIARHAIACDLTPGIAYTTHRAGQSSAWKSYADHMQNTYGYGALAFLDRQAVKQATGSARFTCGVLDHDAAHLHPLAYALGLGRAAEAAGVRIFENSPVARVADGPPAHVRTRHGQVIADQLVYACNGYLGELAPRVGARVMPINNYILATEPLGPDHAHILPGNVAVADSKFVVNYYRKSADNRLLFGGGESYSYRFPKDIAGLARRAMAALYTDLAGLRIDYAWGGTLAITRSRLPYLARLAPHILSASGYSGHGVGMATLSGKLMADALRGQADGFDTFAAVPATPFPGGAAARAPLLKLAMTWYALRDRLGI
ncbi:MAG: FAD-binding oxidoreductase [Pseudomonadota bacterium]